MEVVESPPAPVTTMTSATWVKDTAEKVVMTAVQAFITFLLIGGTIDLSAGKAAAAAGIAAGMTVLTNALQATQLPVFPNFGTDVLARAARTFIQTATALFAVEGFNWGDMSAWQGVAIAGLAAALSVVKAAIASRYNTDNTVTPASVVTPAANQPIPVALPNAA